MSNEEKSLLMKWLLGISTTISITLIIGTLTVINSLNIAIAKIPEQINSRVSVHEEEVREDMKEIRGYVNRNSQQIAILIDRQNNNND
jgi:low affinity Fe/Cu permease